MAGESLTPSASDFQIYETQRVDKSPYDQQQLKGYVS